MKQVFISVLMGCFLGGYFVNVQVNKRYVERLPELVEVQTWKGKNGSGFRGMFLKYEDNTVHVLKDGSDTVYQIALENLHKDTKTWFLEAWGKRELDRKVKQGEITKSVPKGERLVSGKVMDMRRSGLVDTKGFKLVDEPKIDRSLVPNFNQSDYGKKASDCVPNSFAMFIAWWHVRDWVIVSEKGNDYQDKVDWIHQRLARTMGTRNNSGTGVRRAADEFTEFFTDEVETKVAFTYDIIEDYRPENMAQYVSGANCTVLCVSSYRGRRLQGGHAVALKSLSEDGILEFNTWGQKLKGQLKAIPDSEKEKRITVKDENGRTTYKMIKLPQYEIELINRADLPEWFVNQEVRFMLDPENFDNLVVLTPYLPIDDKGAQGEK